MADKKIRVGVVGVGRGQTFATGAGLAHGMELVALCDVWEERLLEKGKEYDVATYTDYDKFLEHDMDAVVLANYFHEHADFTIKAFRAGKHVLSECAACHTMAEGVALAREFKKHPDLIYFFAENYPYMVYNQEMHRLYNSGNMGKFVYGECEYVHPDPAEAKNKRSCGVNHWRNWLPWGTYYCTHALGPVMYITDTRPVRVSGFSMPYDHDDESHTNTANVADIGGVIMCTMDNGAVAKILQGALRGHGNYTRIHCNKGLMENTRHGDLAKLRVWKEYWEKPTGEPREMVYSPDFPEHHELATKAGHGGGDFFTLYHFAQAIRIGEQPWLNIYRGLDMSIAGILGWRSALENSKPYDMPDFRNEEDCKKWENDHMTPNPDAPEEYRLPSSILGKITPTEQGLQIARKHWAEVGYTGE